MPTIAEYVLDVFQNPQLLPLTDAQRIDMIRHIHWMAKKEQKLPVAEKKENYEPLVKKWKNEIYDSSHKFYQRSFSLWRNFCVGWAVGNGLNQEQANAFFNECLQHNLIPSEHGA